MNKNEDTQILIIGSGLAGTISAVKAKEKKEDVLLVRKGYGATALSSGCLEILAPKPYLPEGKIRPQTGKFNLEESLRALPSYHPYRSQVKTSDDDFTYFRSIINKSIKYFFSILDDIKFEGSEEEITQLLTPLGTLKSTNFSLSSIYSGNIKQIKEGDLLLVGIEGFAHFPARFLSQAYKRILEREIKFKNSCDCLYLSLPDKVLNTSNLSPFELASRLDEEDIKNLFQEITAKLPKRRYTHIFFPAILGIEKHNEIINNLSKDLNAVCSEVISLPPSVPGFRLQKALDKILKKKGIKIIRGEVTSCVKEKDRIIKVVVKDRNKEFKVQAENFILASGKFIGGGIKHQDFLKEPIFNLPLFYKNKVVNKTLIEDLLEKEITRSHPLFSVGVKVNSSWQPIDEKDRVIFTNLFAAGNILSGYDYSRDGSGLGVALLSGYLSAMNALT